MAKGYWIVSIDVTDPDTYKEYQALNAAPFAQYGAKFVVRGGPQEAVVGTPRARTVVVEFPSVEVARACFFSEAYQAAMEARQKATVSDQVIIAGYDGPQPGQ